MSQLAVQKRDRVHIGAYVDRRYADELARLARERDRSVSSIGAPRFELGTSSPPDSSSGLPPRCGRWRDVASRLRLRPVKVP